MHELVDDVLNGDRFFAGVAVSKSCKYGGVRGISNLVLPGTRESPSQRVYVESTGPAHQQKMGLISAGFGHEWNATVVVGVVVPEYKSKSMRFILFLPPKRNVSSVRVFVPLFLCGRWLSLQVTHSRNSSKILNMYIQFLASSCHFTFRGIPRRLEKGQMPTIRGETSRMETGRRECAGSCPALFFSPVEECTVGHPNTRDPPIDGMGVHPFVGGS